MYRFAKAAVNISGQAVRQVRHGSSVRKDFHYKYGTGVLISGVIACTGIWAYVLSSPEMVWYHSPVGKVMPKEWREE